MVGGIGPMFYFSTAKTPACCICTAPVQRQSAGQPAPTLQRADDQLSASLVSALDNLQLMKLIGADGVRLRRVDVRGLYLCSGVHRLCPGLCAIISFHYGAENHDELKNLFRKSITMLAIAGVAMLPVPS